MRTVVLNPTIWLLAATALAGVAGAVRGKDAREVVSGVVRSACAWPVLLALAAMAVAGVGSRVVLGYLSPGAYAEEVLAARTFLAHHELYRPRGGGEAAAWLAEARPNGVPWADVPGITPCQANAFENRARFYTEHAHTPMLLLAAVPVVRIAGGHGTYIVLMLASLAAAAAIAAILIDWSGIPWRSRSALLVAVALAGWQPVLAGMRQGDAVLLAAGLAAAAWYVAPRHRTAAALAAGLSACLAVPATGSLLAVSRAGARSTAAAGLVFATGIVLTLSIGGLAIVAGFLHTLAQSAATYADATANYALTGRLLHVGGPRLIGVVIAALLAASWWRSQKTEAGAASFLAASVIAAPIVWSQQLTLLIVPLAVVFRNVVRDGSSLALAGWAIVALSFSLPDTAVIAVSRALATSSVAATIAPLGPLVLWLWTLMPPRAHVSADAAQAAVAVVP